MVRETTLVRVGLLSSLIAGCLVPPLPANTKAISPRAPFNHFSRVGLNERRILGLVLMAPSFAGVAIVQEHHSSLEPGEAPVAQTAQGKNSNTSQPVTEADVLNAIKDVDDLARGLQKGLDAYREHLKKAMEIYGRGLYDPAYSRRLAGFGEDIQTGDLGQTEKVKMAVFASMMRTAGVRLDPDPFRDWADVQDRLDSYQATIDKARDLMAQTNFYVSKSRDNIPPKVLRKLRSQWWAAAERAEKERDRVQTAGPTLLKPGETFAALATAGRSLHFNFFRIEFGRELGNVIALAQLTYSGKTDAGDRFLLTVLTERYGKTHLDTFVEPRAILVHSDAQDALRYGHAVTIHDYSGYNVVSARVADVAPGVRDWVWKTMAPPNATQPALSELEQAVRRVQDSRGAIDQAIDAFLRLASQAVHQNDDTLKAEARAMHRKARLPDQDLRVSVPGVRARLYATRALFAGDPRFLAALDEIASARRRADSRIQEARELFSYFSRIPVYAAPDLPWKSIDKVAVDLMAAGDDVLRAGSRSDESLPRIPQCEEPVVTTWMGLPPNVIVAQVNRGPEREGDPAILIVEHILRDVHWAIKGVDRREYTSELIKVSPVTGIHQVQFVLGHEYIQGPGGIRQIFRRLSDDEPPD